MVWNIWSWPCVWWGWSHCILLQDCGDYLPGYIDQCGLVGSSRSFGAQCSIDGSVFKGPHVNIGHNWTYRWSHGNSFGLFKNWFWNRKYVLFRQKPISYMMLMANKIALFGNYVSCSNLTLITSNADATGIDVKSAVTSNEVIHSPYCILVFLILSAHSLLLLTW